MPAATLTTASTPAWEEFEVPAHAHGGQVAHNLYAHLASYVPKHPGAYLRSSSDRFGLEAGVDRQLAEEAAAKASPAQGGKRAAFVEAALVKTASAAMRASRFPQVVAAPTRWTPPPGRARGTTRSGFSW